MTYENLIVEERGATRLVTLNRPHVLNAVTPELAAELEAVLAATAADERVGTVVLTGAGRAFCVGADLNVRDPEAQDRRNRHLNGIIRLLVSMPQPVIAAVNGPAVAGGCSLTAAADLAIAAEGATFNQVYVRRGLLPAFGSLYLLPRLVGPQAAKWLMFTGDTITAAQAKEMGLVLEVVPADELLPRALALAEHLNEQPRQALFTIKRLANRAITQLVDLPTLQDEADTEQARLQRSSESQAAVQRFWAEKGRR